LKIDWATLLDTYSHVAPGLQQAAADKFDGIFSFKQNEVSLTP